MTGLKFDVNKLKDAAKDLEDASVQESSAIIESVAKEKGRTKIYKDGRPTHIPKSVTSRYLKVKASSLTVEIVNDLVKKEKTYLNRSHFIEQAILEKLSRDTEGKYNAIKNRHWWFKEHENTKSS